MSIYTRRPSHCLFDISTNHVYDPVRASAEQAAEVRKEVKRLACSYLYLEVKCLQHDAGRPDYPAPVVRNAGTDRELTMMRWGMPPPPRTDGPPVTNIRNTAAALARLAQTGEQVSGPRQ